MASFSILDEKREDELHAQRLLRVEERPFERIKLRLLSSTTPMQAFLARSSNVQSTPADVNPDEPVSEEENAVEPTSLDQQKQFLKDLNRFREDVILDFAAFDASIARIQFLRDANEKERQRYAAEKLKIEATAQDVIEDTARLKIRLDEAQKTLAIRKGYDVLAEKITKDESLKARDEQRLNIERLQAEIEELEREGSDLGNAWKERRSVLGLVVEQSMRLRRVVRDEKEPEAEDRIDGEDDGEGDGDEDMLGMDEQRGREGSNMGTPRPMDDAPTPLPGVHESGAMTPRSTLGDTEVLTPKQEASLDDNEPAEGINHDMEMQDGEARERPNNVPVMKINDEMDIS